MRPVGRLPWVLLAAAVVLVVLVLVAIARAPDPVVSRWRHDEVSSRLDETAASRRERLRLDETAASRQGA